MGLMVAVIGAEEWPPAMLIVLVQLAGVQVQPAPDIERGVKEEVGSSVTVIVPVVGPAEAALETPMV
jgi:hypothetical protein